MIHNSIPPSKELFLKSYNFFIVCNWKMTSFRNISGQSWNSGKSEISLKVELLKFKTFNFDLKFCWNWSFFHYEKIMRFKKVLSYLKLEGQGRGIIMEVTRPFLLGPFYLVKWPVNPNILAASGVCIGIMVIPNPCPSASRLLRTFFKSHNFFIMEKWPDSEEF